MVITSDRDCGSAMWVKSMIETRAWLLRKAIHEKQWWPIRKFMLNVFKQQHWIRKIRERIEKKYKISWSTRPAHSSGRQWISLYYVTDGLTDGNTDGRAYWRTDNMCENSDHYRPRLCSASWIKKLQDLMIGITAWMLLQDLNNNFFLRICGSFKDILTARQSNAKVSLPYQLVFCSELRCLVSW